MLPSPAFWLNVLRNQFFHEILPTRKLCRYCELTQYKILTTASKVIFSSLKAF